MTSKERIIAAMRGCPVDTVPISPRTGAYLLYRYGNQDLETQLRFQQEYDQDTIWYDGSGMPNPFDSPFVDIHAYAPSVSVDLEKSMEGEVQVIKRTIHTPAGKLYDLFRIPPAGKEYGMNPNPEKSEFMIKDRSDLDKVRYILPKAEQCVDLSLFQKHEALAGDRAVIALFQRSPVDHFAGEARGVVNLMLDYYDDPDFLREILHLFTEHIMSETRTCLEHGVRHVFGSWYYTSLSTGWSPEMWRELFFPIMKEHVNLVHRYDATYTMYDDGKLMPLLEDYIQTGADVLETMCPPPVGDVDLKQAKQIAGNRITLKGYVDLIYVMQRGSAQDVRRTVLEALETAAPGGRFILGSSDSFRENTPEENIAMYFLTAREFGAAFL